MNRLKAAREELKWSQDILSEKSNVSRATISALENDRPSCVKTVTLIKLADALGKTVSELFF